MKNKRLSSVNALAWGLLALMQAVCFIVLLQNGALNLNSNILALLPATEADPAVEEAFERFSERNMQRLIFLVVNPDSALARQGADELSQALQDLPWIASVDLRRDAAAQSDMARFYFAHRHRLLSGRDEALLAAGEFAAFTDDVLNQAYSPFSGGLVELLQQDPFLLSWRAALASADQGNVNLALTEGYPQTLRDGEFHVLLMAELGQSPFNQQVQQETLAAIAGVEARWADQENGSSLIRAGALFHTAHAYATASREISLIGGSSLLLIAALLLLAFRSARPLALVGITLGFGICSGFLAVRLLFGEVQILTMVFGCSLVGVAVDYAFHYLVIDEQEESLGTAQRTRLGMILPAISLGLLSSVMGYAVLLATPFSGLRQMAVFSIFGLTGAWLTVVLLFPRIPMHHGNSAFLLQLCRAVLAAAAGRSARLCLLAATTLPLAALLILVSRERTVADVRDFQAQEPGLLIQEQRIAQVLDAPAANQFFLVKGDSAQAVLERLEAAQAHLDALVEQGAIADHLSVADWLPSIERQRRHQVLLGRLHASGAGAVLVESGLISQEYYSAAQAAFERDRGSFLEPEEWLASSPGRETAYLWLEPEMEGGSATYAAVVALNGVMQLDLLKDFVIDDPGGSGARVTVAFIDKVSTVNAMLAAYRDNVERLLIVTFAAIFLVLCLRQGARKAALIMLSPLLAISATVVGLTLLGETFSLFNMLALFLVIGIGVDFGIFFAEARKPGPATLLAILLSALTTIFSFGLLALSASSVIHSFGLSMLFGISCTLLLAPVVGNLLAGKDAVSSNLP